MIMLSLRDPFALASTGTHNPSVDVQRLRRVGLQALSDRMNPQPEDVLCVSRYDLPLPNGPRDVRLHRQGVPMLQPERLQRATQALNCRTNLRMARLVKPTRKRLRNTTHFRRNPPPYRLRSSVVERSL